MKNEINIYKTKNFHKIVLDIVFPCVRKENYSIYGNLLIRLLSKKSNKYPTEEMFSNALIENYVMGFSFSKSICGENWFYTFHVVLADNSILKEKEYNYEKTLQFVFDSIYNPFALDNSFYASEMEIAKKQLSNYIESGYKNIKHYASIRTDEILDDENYFFDSPFYHKEDIENITEQELFSYFKEVIYKKRPLLFIVGNVDSNFVNIFEKILSKKEENFLIPYTIKPYPKVKKIKTLEEVKEYNQSIVKFVYKIQNFHQEDIVKLNVLNFILNSQSSRVLHEFLRIREKLVYTAGSSFSARYGLLYITAQIYKEQHLKTIETIKDIMKILNDKDFLKEKLEKVKLRKRINLERQKDDIFCYLEDLKGTFFKIHDTFVEEYKNVKKITVENMLAFLKRLQLDTIYYLEGSKDE